ncbi:MAG: helix-turn-helix domain-containing protein [Anaerolineae bacterium]|nr:helix-turn-helix domain-containing protein [Anaerolineae bacterium]
MDDLGNWLRGAREAQGLTYQDVEKETRIRARYVEALEAGDYEAMSGGEAQLRGFLRRYAHFVGLSPEEAILRYERQVHKRPEEPPPVVSPTPESKASPDLSLTPSPWRSLWVILALAVVVAMALGGTWLIQRSGWLSGSAGTTPSAATTAAPVTGTVTAPLPSPPATDAAPSPAPTFPVAPAGGVTVTLEAAEHVWVRVTADGFTAFEGMISPGGAASWYGDEMVVVESGNGAGLVVVVNGQSQGRLCGRGELCARGWGPRGEIEVTQP